MHAKAVDLESARTKKPGLCRALRRKRRFIPSAERTAEPRRAGRAARFRLRENAEPGALTARGAYGPAGLRPLRQRPPSRRRRPPPWSTAPSPSSSVPPSPIRRPSPRGSPARCPAPCGRAERKGVRKRRRSATCSACDGCDCCGANVRIVTRYPARHSGLT